MAGSKRLVVLSKEFKGQSFTLDKNFYSVGREEGSSDIPLPDASISTEHAEIIANDDGGYTLKDLGSTNGTRINSNPLTGEKDLKAGDVIQFGLIEILFDDSDVEEHHATGPAVDITQSGTITISTEMTNLSPVASIGGQKKKSGNSVVNFIIVLLALVAIYFILDIFVLG